MFDSQDPSPTSTGEHRVRAIRDAVTRARGIVQDLHTTWKTLHRDQATVAGERSLCQLTTIIGVLAAEAEHGAIVAFRQHASVERLGELIRIPPDIAQHSILDTAEASAFCGFSVAHWRRLYRTGKVPKPIQLSTRKLGWRAGDLVDWLQTRVDSS